MKKQSETEGFHKKNDLPVLKPRAKVQFIPGSHRFLNKLHHKLSLVNASKGAVTHAPGTHETVLCMYVTADVKLYFCGLSAVVFTL